MTGDRVERLLRFRFIYRLASFGFIGYPLILCWRRGWLSHPRGEATASLRDGRLLHCQLDDATQRTMYLGLFEPTETQLVRELLSPGDTLLDIGAHIGWFSTVGSQRVGSTGLVVAFEPFERTLKMLRVNLQQNNCTNVRVVESALGSQAGTLTLASSGGDSGAVTALVWGTESRVEVPVVTLDEAEKDLTDVTLMKIDVEGWETNVLRGGGTTLSRIKSVLIEINGPAILQSGSSPEEIFELLRAAGFSYFFRVTEGGLRRFIPSQVDNVLAVRSDAPPTPSFWKQQGLRPRTYRRLEMLN